MSARCFIGLDEVGRGCLAGPVVVAAAAIPIGYRVSGLGHRGRMIPLRDSKQLSSGQREHWVEVLSADPRVRVAYGRVYPKGVDRLNIARAANLAALRAYQRLTRILHPNGHRLSPKIYLDGGLYLGKKGLVPRARTVIRGDQKIPAIQIASIFAKVHRDTYMTRLSKKFPEYGFEIHKGYGTKAHLQALRTYGISIHHRLTFLKKYPTIIGN